MSFNSFLENADMPGWKSVSESTTGFTRDDYQNSDWYKYQQSDDKEAYLADILKSYGIDSSSDYYQQLISSGNLSTIRDYQSTGFDNFMRWIGGKAPEASLKESAWSAWQQEIASALDSMRQQEYNSAQSQVEREKAAGLNPDLTGTSSDSAGSSSNVDENAGTLVKPSDMPSTGLQEVSGFSQFLTSVLNTSVGLVRGFIGIQEAQSAVANSDADFIRKIGDIFTSGNFTDSEQFAQVMEGLFSSRSSRNRFRAGRSFINEYAYQLGQNKKTHQVTGSLSELLKDKANPLMPTEGTEAEYNSIIKWWSKVSGDANQLLQKGQEIQLLEQQISNMYLSKKAELGTAENQAILEYNESGIDADVSGELNSDPSYSSNLSSIKKLEAELGKMKAENSKATSKFINKTAKWLEDKADHGEKWAGIALTAVRLVELYMNGNNSFSFSRPVHNSYDNSIQNVYKTGNTIVNNQ